jgi:hypothetical protein
LQLQLDEQEDPRGYAFPMLDWELSLFRQIIEFALFGSMFLALT